MTDLMDLVDPAAGHRVDRTALRAKVDGLIGGEAPGRHASQRRRRPWMVALAGFAVLFSALAVPVLLRPPADDGMLDPGFGTDLPGVDMTIPLASGGVQTGVVEGETIWVVTALAGQLQQVSAPTGEVVATYPIDGHVEGVVLGNDRLWLLSYSNGGEILRFDRSTEQVDLTIPIDAEPWAAAWFADSLWVSTSESQLLRISAEGRLLSTQPGDVRGTGFGFLWVNDPATGLVNSLSAEGILGEVVIPTDGAITPTGDDIRGISEAAGYLWISFSDPGANAVARFDLQTGELLPLATATAAGAGTEFDGFVWMTSRFDNTLVRVEPAGGNVTQFPLPGKPGGLFVADDALWVALYQPGSLLRLDVAADLIQTQPTVIAGGSNDHRLTCTAPADYVGGKPTVILEPEGWINYGSWSVIQALVSAEGYRVCANGYLSDRSIQPAERATDLSNDLQNLGISGPFILVGAGDGVHTVRLFADDRTDLVGVVLVDPIPVGFGEFYDGLLGLVARPPWLDMPGSVSEGLTDFGNLPLVIISQDPDVAYLNERFIDYAGTANAEAINGRWQDGLAFYKRLSTDAREVVARDAAMTAIVWSQQGIVVRQITDLLDRLNAN